MGDMQIAAITEDLIPTQEEIVRKSELKKILSQINPDSWEIAKMRNNGMSIRDIYSHFDAVYSMQDIAYMFKQVAACNRALAMQSAEIMRQTLVDELDSYKQQFLANADISEPKTYSALIKGIELKAKLLGVVNPEVHKVDITATIQAASRTLTEKLNAHRANVVPAEVPQEEKVPQIIDVDYQEVVSND